MFHYVDLDKDPPIYSKDYTHMPITNYELANRAKFFSKALFGVEFKGSICFENNEYLNGASGKFYPGIDSWDDRFDQEEYEDYKEASILLYESLAESTYINLNNVLIHELLHFYLWYIGYNYGDGSSEFINKARQLGVCRNYDHKWNDEEKKWEQSDISEEKLQSYEDAYQEYVKTNKINHIDWE